MYDTIVVGAGPSGLQCATVLAFDGRKVLLLDEGRPGGQILQSPLILNVAGYARGFSGEDWAYEAYRQAANVGVQLKADSARHHVKAVVKDRQDVFTVRTAFDEYRARSVVMASGCQEHALAIPGARLEGVHYSLHPATEVEGGRKVVVIGGANSAGTAVMLLSNLRDMDVTLLHRGDLHISRGIQDDWGEHVRVQQTEVYGIASDRTLMLYTDAGVIHGVQDVYVMAGRQPNTMYSDTLVNTNTMGFVYADLYKGRTDCTGLYAIGNVVHNSVRTMGAALGSGVTCAYYVGEFLAMRGV